MPSFDQPALAWVALAILAAIIEVSTPHFGTIFISVGGVAAALAAWLGLGVISQFIVFTLVLSLSLAVLRPRFVSKLAPGVPSRTDTLVGREGLVTSDIDPVIGGGRVTVRGEDWAARSAAPLKAGTRIRVLGADGIVLEVIPT